MTDHYPDAGRYGCVATPGFGSWTIRTFTRSWANHVFITIDDYGGIIQAEPGGVRKGHLGDYHGDRLTMNLREPYTPAQRLHVADAASKLIGVPYDDAAIVSDGLEALGLHWGWLVRLSNSTHELMCSMMAVKIGQEAGFDWLCGRSTPAEVTPGDLARREHMVAWLW